MNLLSVGAAYGVVALAVQGGWFGGLFGIDEPVPVPSFIPMMMFAILFGLSMDYEVFLLSRIREEYARTGDNATAVADGLAHTARVITAAAAVMISVFLAFVLADQVFLKMMGIGLGQSRSSWSTRRWCGWCSCLRRWSCSATPTGGRRSGIGRRLPHFHPRWLGDDASGTTPSLTSLSDRDAAFAAGAAWSR
jgi:hypothetical protein